MHRYPNNNMSASLQTKMPFTMEVLGQGTVTGVPDQAVIILGAVTEGPVLQTVQTENAKAITNIISSLLNENIPREKIQTEEFRIEVQYDYQNGIQMFRGYKVSHLLKITTGRVEQAGNVVDTAVSHGANTVSSIRFTIVELEFYKNEALSLAVRNASQKAQTIAETLEVSLSALPSQVEELTRIDQAIPYTGPLLTASAVTPIQPGMLSIDAYVRVRYLYG
jgi:uncharacterized protein YggE